MQLKKVQETLERARREFLRLEIKAGDAAHRADLLGEETAQARLLFKRARKIEKKARKAARALSRRADKAREILYEATREVFREQKKSRAKSRRAKKTEKPRGKIRPKNSRRRG
jgi:hypothetical protein